MANRRRRRKQSKNTSIVNWIVFGFFAFAMYHSMSQATPESPDPITASFTKTADVIKNRFDDYKNKVIPDAKPVAESPVAEAKESPSESPKAPNAESAKETATEAPKESPVETAKESPAVEAPSTPKCAIDIATAYPNAPYRIFTVTPGNGAPNQCGDTVKIKLTVWGTSGKKLFSTAEPVSFTVGASETFVGLEQGIIGMKPGEKRSLSIPPILQKTEEEKPTIVEIPLPDNQTILVDVESVP